MSDSKLSALTEATVLTFNDMFLLNNGGSSKKVSLDTIVNKIDVNSVFVYPTNMVPLNLSGSVPFDSSDSPDLFEFNTDSASFPSYRIRRFDSSITEHVYFPVKSPTYWDSGNISVKLYCGVAGSATSKTVQWVTRCFNFPDGGTTSINFSGVGTQFSQTGMTNGYVYETSSGSFAVEGTSPTGGEILIVRIGRYATDPGDTLDGVDAALYGATVTFL